jgi:hypothetical protein
MMNVSTLLRMLIVATILLVGAPTLAEVHGVLRVVKGDVQIKSGSTGVTAKAKLGQEVYPKDTIITGKEARAKVVMIDNNELNISPDSHIEIQNYEYAPAENKKDVLLNVLYGKVRSKVEQKYDGKTSKFQVKTPSAVAGVRGTDFVTGYNQTTRTTTVVTFRGAVEFGLPGAGGTIRNAVSVTPGKMSQIAASGGGPASPSNVPKDQMAKFDRDSKAEPSSGSGNSPGGNSSSGGDPRTPAGKIDGGASNGGGNSMIDPRDLATCTNCEKPIPPPPPQPPPPPVSCSTCVAPPPPQQRPLTGTGGLSVHVNP